MSISKSPFGILGSDVIRYGIQPFVEPTCSELTKQFGCKGLLSVFTDEKGNRKDCAWKCISQCKPSELISIVNPPDTITFEHNGRQQTVNVYDWKVTFTGSYDDEEEEFFMREATSSSVVLEDPTGKGGSVQKDKATKKLCKWFKRWAEQGASIKVVAELIISPDNSRLSHNSHIAKFSSPWIRPLRDWKVKWVDDYFRGGKRPIVKLSRRFKSVSKPEQIKETEEYPISELLPVGLMDVPHAPSVPSLVSYGVAHPGIHHISRRHRQASQHRPRHFHSPTRKETAKRSSRAK